MDSDHRIATGSCSRVSTIAMDGALFPAQSNCNGCAVSTHHLALAYYYAASANISTSGSGIKQKKCGAIHTGGGRTKLWRVMRKLEKERGRVRDGYATIPCPIHKPRTSWGRLTWLQIPHDTNLLKLETKKLRVFGKCIYIGTSRTTGRSCWV